MAPVTNYAALCRELAGLKFGELDMVGARSVLRRYSTSWFEAAKRRKAGIKVGFPRRKKALVPVRWYNRTFVITAKTVRIPVCRGSEPLLVHLSREIPYPIEAVRSLTLVCEAGRLYLDITAELPVENHDLDPARVAGIDLGVIHPFAVAFSDQALLISGRALRAEERLHLEDTKRRQRKMSRKIPKRGQRGSRRYRKLRRSQQRAEARHRRAIRQSHHEAARKVIEFALENKIATLVVGDLKGITHQDAGRRQNLRLRQWRRTHLLSCLKDKAEIAGIEVVLVNERGTSSSCPECEEKVAKPRNRNFSCKSCGYAGHRDITGARNIAALGGGRTSTPVLVTHRRAGRPPARRDRRRHLYDARRSCPAPGRPGVRSRESLVGKGHPASSREAPCLLPSNRRGSANRSLR